MKLFLREISREDETEFINAMQRSVKLHGAWMNAPLDTQAFVAFYENYQKPTHKCFLLCTEENEICGVFNLSEIVRGVFQNAYLGYAVVVDFAERGFMSDGLKLLLQQVFVNLNLHRIEANIQPENTRSIYLVKQNGFRKEGYSPRYLKINDEWRDHERWAITQEDWLMLSHPILESLT